MKTAAIVHYVGATAKSRRVVASLCADLRDQGYATHLIDIGEFTTISQQSPPSWLLWLIGHKIHTEHWLRVLQSLGVTQHFPGNQTYPVVNITAEEETVLATAVESELLTYFRREHLEPSSAWIRELRKLLWSNARQCLNALVSVFSEIQPDLVLIPNGRTSRQRSARVAAEELNVAIEFYENGRARPESYYRGTTQPHDRITSQAEVAGFMEDISAKQVHALASEWLDTRMSSGSGTNSFSSQWEDQSLIKPTPAGETAVFFTSSADEFLAFGPMWQIDSWQSQFQAFDEVMSVFEESDIRLILRVHPNLTQKSRRYFRAAVEEIESLKNRHPQLTIHWHTSSVNSYDLVRQADYVVAERSTIGLEASLMGKPVWVTQAAQWDLVADVRQLLASSDITRGALETWDVEPAGAQRFVAYWMLQEHPLRFSWQEFATWNLDVPPTLLRAANLFVKNPWWHRLHLAKTQLDRWSNSLAGR